MRKVAWAAVAVGEDTTTAVPLTSATDKRTLDTRVITRYSFTPGYTYPSRGQPNIRSMIAAAAPQGKSRIVRWERICRTLPAARGVGDHRPASVTGSPAIRVCHIRRD